MPSSNRQSKRKAKGQENTLATDTFHNHDVPCCQSLKEIWENLIDNTPFAENVTLITSAASSFSPLLRDILLQLLYEEISKNAPLPSKGPSKKKKKKRKKKKAVAVKGAKEEGDGDDVHTQQGVTTTTALEPVSLPDNQLSISSGAPLSSKVDASVLDSGPSSPANAEETVRNPKRDAILSYMRCKLSENGSLDHKLTANSPSIQDLIDMLTRVCSEQQVVFQNSSLDMYLKTIQCRSCRTRTEDAIDSSSLTNLNSWNLSSNGFLLGPCLLPSPPLPESDAADSAFDYVALEEGTIMDQFKSASTNNLFQLEKIIPESSDKDSSWKLIRQGGGDLVWDKSDILLLLEYLMSSCSPDTYRRVGVHADSTVDMSAAFDSAEQLQTELMSDFTTLAQRIQTQVEKESRLQASAQSGFDPRAQATCNDINSEMDAILGDILRIVYAFTKSYLELIPFVGQGRSPTDYINSAPDMQWALLGIEKIWLVYCDGLNSILVEGLTPFDRMRAEEAKLDPQGNSPINLFGPSLLDAFRQMTRVKIRTIPKIVHSIHQVLDNVVYVDETVHPRWQCRFSEKLFGYMVFFQQLSPNGEPLDSGNLAESIDIAMKDVQYFLREWTEPIHERSISRILETQRRRQDKMARLIQSLHYEFSTGIKEGIIISDQQQALGESVKNMKLAMESSTDSMETLFDLRATLGEGAFQAVRSWLRIRHELLRSYKSTSEASNKAVPYDLLRWLATRHAESTARLGQESHSCEGTTGIARARSIMALLIVGWMSDRSWEWASELAQQELMEDEMVTQKAKAKKKSKKKKKVQAKDARGEPAKNDSRPLTVSEEEVDEESQIKNSYERKESNGEKGVTTSQQPMSAVDNIPLEGNASLNLLIESKVTVGVIDANGAFQSAEDFLSSRMQGVLADGRLHHI